jgi:enamine deaminase RidA (YjgF/YER057c/UK114 family)/GNAT superfamily N-acetyltransferase
MAERRVILSGSTFEEEIGYARAVVDGDWVHVSGTTGFDYAAMTISGDVTEQAEQCLRNIGSTLAEAGCSFTDVVRVRYLLPDREDFPPCWPVLRRCFGDVRPAATMLVCGLSDARMKIEIEVDARRPAQPPPVPAADGPRVQVRRAGAADADKVALLAGELAQSFAFSRQKFDRYYPGLLTVEDTRLLLATDGGECLGYLLGFRHLTFYANGPVAWEEEIVVRSGHRGRGIGRALMSAFERWATDRDCVLVALATRRAAPFYHALGYEDSATYLRKVLKVEAAG